MKRQVFLLAICMGTALAVSSTSKKTAPANPPAAKAPTATKSTPSTPTKESAPMTPSSVTLPSGLSYQIITAAPATEKAAARGNKVTVHYTGWLNDGTDNPGKKFDSSHDRKEPFTFPLGAGYVIQGWDQGVEGMKIGEKRRLFIPANLGYGARGVPGAIPGNAALIFDVDLIAVK
jgi:FKBP-type peptidyl-prolyl cis-trans isomerase FkpA